MKNTGIIRRIDDLGRVVIPKEIRRILSINEGDLLEIYIENDMVCYKKYIAETDYIDSINSIIQTLLGGADINRETGKALNDKLKEAIEILKQK